MKLELEKSLNSLILRIRVIDPGSLQHFVENHQKELESSEQASILALSFALENQVGIASALSECISACSLPAKKSK